MSTTHPCPRGPSRGVCRPAQRVWPWHSWRETSGRAKNESPLLPPHRRPLAQASSRRSPVSRQTSEIAAGMPRPQSNSTVAEGNRHVANASPRAGVAYLAANRGVLSRQGPALSLLLSPRRGRGTYAVSRSSTSGAGPLPLGPGRAPFEVRLRGKPPSVLTGGPPPLAVSHCFEADISDVLSRRGAPPPGPQRGPVCAGPVAIAEAARRTATSARLLWSPIGLGRFLIRPACFAVEWAAAHGCSPVSRSVEHSH